MLRLSRTKAPSLHWRYPASSVLRAYPSPQDARPVRHRRPVGRPRPHHGVSRVARAFLVYMLPPLPRRSDCVRICSILTVVSIFPDSVVGSICASSFSRLARCSLALRPAHSRRHQFVTLFTRRLQPFRYLHDCSGCYRLEPWPGGTCTHRKAPPFHGAHTKRSWAALQRSRSKYRFSVKVSGEPLRSVGKSVIVMGDSD